MYVCVGCDMYLFFSVSSGDVSDVKGTATYTGGTQSRKLPGTPSVSPSKSPKKPFDTPEKVNLTNIRRGILTQNNCITSSVTMTLLSC